MEFKKKKLLVVIQGNVGGAERIAVTVTKELNSVCYDVVYCLVGMTSDNKYPIEDFIPNKWRLIHIKRMHSVRLIFELLRVLIKEKPDTVFSSTLYINDKLLLFRSLFPNVKYIIRCENYLYTFQGKQLRLMRSIYRKANLIIAQTEEMRDELVGELGIPKEKAVVLHNPIDTKTIDLKIENEPNPYPEDNNIVFCACGRFSKQKGFDLLIDAFSIVEKSVHNVHLYIIGDYTGKNEDYHHYLLDKAEALGIHDSISFLGYQSNPYVYLKYADCFVLSSRWEGLPNVMIEALYLGTPVAAFKCIPIIQRIVSDGIDGCLAEKEDIDSLAEAMIKASKLGRIKSLYKSASAEDFARIFDNTKQSFMKQIAMGGVNFYRFLRDKYLYCRRYLYLKEIRKYIGQDTSIISSNCFAGRIMQDLGMEYNTPTLGLWFMPDDFPKFCSNLEKYLHSEIKEKSHSKNELGEYKRTHRLKHPYPVGSLGDDVEVHFLHYYTFEEAVEKFKRRASRVNINNMIMIGFEQNGCTEEDVKAFDAIPYPRKLFFCSKPYSYKSVIFIKEFAHLDNVGDPYKKGHVFYRYFAKWLEEHN